MRLLFFSILAIALASARNLNAGEFEDAFAASQAQAMKEFPELGNRNSRLFDVVDYLVRGMREENVSLQNDPNWPLSFARYCAENLDKLEEIIESQRNLGVNAPEPRTFREKRALTLNFEYKMALHRKDYAKAEEMRLERDKFARTWARELRNKPTEPQPDLSPSSPPPVHGGDQSLQVMIRLLEAQLASERSERKRTKIQENIDQLRALDRLLRSNQPTPLRPGSGPVGLYRGGSNGHSIKKNIDSGKFIQLEDGSLWEVVPLEKIEAMLWLAYENIVVVESDKGTPGYGYLLINTDGKTTAHAKLISQ